MQSAEKSRGHQFQPKLGKKDYWVFKANPLVPFDPRREKDKKVRQEGRVTATVVAVAPIRPKRRKPHGNEP